MLWKVNFCLFVWLYKKNIIINLCFISLFFSYPKILLLLEEGFMICLYSDKNIIFSIAVVNFGMQKTNDKSFFIRMDLAIIFRVLSIKHQIHIGAVQLYKHIVSSELVILRLYNIYLLIWSLLIKSWPNFILIIFKEHYWF